MRRDFPIFDAEHPPALFDGPGGSQLPRSVIRAVADYLGHHNANTHGYFATSRDTDAAIARARARLACFLGARSPEQIVFGANMTTLAFRVARTLAREWKRDDEIVVTRLDHQANVAPWWLAAEEREVRVREVPFDPETLTLDYAALEATLSPRVRLVAVGAASNAVGTVNDVARVAALARQAGALCFVDAVHLAPHLPIDVTAIGCDFLACSAYKFFGPHVGVLWGRGELLEWLRPAKLPPAADASPERWEVGTQNHEGIVGAAAAVDWIAGLDDADSAEDGTRSRLLRGMSRLHAHEGARFAELLGGLATLKSVRIYSPPRGTPRTPTVAFTVNRLHADAVASALAERGVAVWSGDFYAQTVVDDLGLRERGGLVRAGVAPYTTENDVARLLSGVAGLRDG